MSRRPSNRGGHAFVRVRRAPGGRLTLPGLLATVLVAAALPCAGGAGGLLQPPAARAAVRRAPTCPSRDYTLQTIAERIAGSEVGIAWIGLRGPYGCTLRLRLRFAVQPAGDPFANPQGLLPGVGGNGSTVAVDGELRPGTVTLRAWRWRNWCGVHRRFALLARPLGISGQAAWAVPISPPSCAAPGQASSLAAVPMRVRRCSADEYRLSLFGQGYRQRIIEAVTARLRGHLPCVLRTRLTLAVEQAGQGSRASAIAGNPSTVAVGAVLAPGAEADVFFAWFNWCGARSSLRWSVTDRSHRVLVRTGQAPACEDPSAPSLLQPAYEPPAPEPPR